MKNNHGLIKHFRQWSVRLSMLLLMIQMASAQNITRIEYFYDTDPGFGLGTAATGYTSSSNVSAFTFSASIASLSNGFHTLYIRSRDANNKWSFTNNTTFVKYAAQSGTPSAGNITRIEYFFDTDPGFGNGTAATGYTSSTNVSAFSFPASIASLSNGFHTLYIRSRDANNKWSFTNNSAFIKYAAQTGTPSAGNINKLEYFVDTDPGVGLATNVPVTAAADISGQVFAVPLASYGYGFHTLYVRSRDANNKWSLTNYGVFIKYQGQTGATAAGNINKMEYFVDADPGVGLATNVPVTAAADIAGQVVAVPITSYGAGFHTIYFRSRDTNGKWSLTNYGSFIRYQSQTGPSAAGNIVKLEYFIDTDPGFGLGTNVPVTAAADISGQVASVNISAVANGFHTVYLRSKDSNGKWSLTNYGSFIKYAAQTASTAAASNVIKMEYFIDTDPGFGNGANIPFTHSTNVSGLVATADLTGVANGFHTIYIRSMDTLHKWSLTNYATFTGGQLQAPTASITVNGPSAFCLGAGTYLQANYSASATYQWKLNTVNINGATGITYVPTQSGSYTVVVTNAIGSATSSAVSITVNPVPTATISANGALTFCQGGSVTLSVNATANATYQWHLNGGNINGATTTSYIANQSGVYDVLVTSNNGCSTLSAHDTVTVNPSAGATITPGGNTTFCTGDSVTLYGNTGSGLTYHWSNNATTSSIKVFTQGNYSLTVTNSSNCSASAAAVAVTVLTAPSATITPNGPTTFCNGSSVILAANTGSGLSYTWTGGATTSSITVSSSGVYYVTVSNSGCSRVSSPVTVTVNPGPVVGITGTSSTICQGHIDTLTATGATTYAWAGVGLNTYTGATVYATPSITTVYTVTGTTSGCIGTATFTVNINANNTQVSTTTPTICSGSSAVLNASGALTYAWSPSGTLNASTGATVTASPLSQTTYTVTGTSGTCTSTATITINVNTTVVPSVSITTPQTTVCAGTSVTFTASATNGGASPSYQWYKNGVIQVGSSGTFATASLSNNDSVWCIMTSNAPCPSPSSATSNHIHMTVNPVVTPTISISVDQNPVCVGTAVTFTATITNGGASPVYVWKKNNVTVGSNSATYILSSPATNDSVWCILTSNASCASPTTVTSSKIKMVVNQISAPTVSVTPSQNPICTGATILFNAITTNGGTTPAYQWYKNGSTVGSNSDTYSDNALANNDSVWCVMTSNATCASPLTVTSNKVVLTIAPTVTPSVIVSTPQTSVCAGSSITFTAAPTNGGGAPTYQWYKNGVIQSGNTDTYVSVVLNNDSVWCIMISSATCPVPTSATSNKVHMTVNATVTPAISITGVPNPICAGASVTFTATITNGGATPVYQWKKNNLNVGSGASTFITTALSNNDSVWCVLTSNAPCPSPASVTSNKIHMTVNPIVTPTISITASQNPICTGTSVTFTAAITNGGTTPAYQWYKNGATVGGNSATYSFGAFASNDSVWCVLTSNANCLSITTATSSKVIITITPTVTPSVSITAGQNPVCAGTSVTFTASPTNGGANPTYQWRKNGVVQAGNTGTYTGTVANNDSVWCIMTSNAQCPSPATATSNKVYMVVNPIVTPTISIAVSQNPICDGDSATFTATITNGGANPVYQWKKNNQNVGTGGATYGVTTLANNDSVWCVLTSNAPCPSPVSVTSNKVKMTVNPIVSPGLSITASQNPICTGTNVTFTATAVNGGNTPVYHWYKNGNTVGANSASYSDNALADNDSVWCVVASSKNCVFPNTATSNKVIMTITPTVVPSVSVSTSVTTICSGTSATFTASPTNGGNSPSYQWYKNGVLQVGSTNIFNTTGVANNDSVWCVMTSTAPCPSPATAASNKVYMTVNPILVPTVSVTVSQNPSCAGDSVTFTTTVTNGGGNPVFQWMKNGGVVGSNTSSYTLTVPVNNDSVWSVLTSDALCASPVTVTSSKVHMTVNPITTPTVTVSASANPACSESTVTFTATTTSGGAAPDFQWYKNGGTVGISSSSYSDNTLVNNDSVWAVLTSNATCISTSTVTSSNVVMTITPTVVPEVSVSSSDTTLCAGTVVSFTASPINGGASPTYNWYKNGTLKAGNTGTYTDAALTNNDSVWCVMTSNEACPSPATVSATGIRVSVLQPAHYSYSHSICQGESYPFHAMNLTAAGTYNDTVAASNGCDSITTLTLTVHQLPSPVVTHTGANLTTGVFATYQWLLNGDTIAGATSQNYTATVTGSYSVIVSDNNGCGNTATAVTVVISGIENVSLVNLLIYPNPTANLLNVRADNLTEVASIELRDDLGRLLFAKEVTGNAIREQLDLSNYASGVYLLVIKNSDKTLAAKRVFKN